MMKVSGVSQIAWWGVALMSALVLSGCAGNPKTHKNQASQGIEAEAASSPSLETLRAYAESGDIGAQFDLGLSLAESNAKDAVKWLESAAMQGFGAAAYELGQLQDDPKRAVEWYSMAAAMDHVGAKFELGNAYMHGRGTAKEPAWGLMWYERAARAGRADAQFAMGEVMAGTAVGPAQPDEALVWLLIADQNKHVDAAALIEAVKTRLTPELIGTAEQRAAAWTDQPASNGVYDRAVLRFTQYALNRLGYDVGPADGLSGDRTETAIAAFRAKEGIGGDGLNGRVLDLLRERVSVLN